MEDFPALNWSHVFSGHAINSFKPDPGLLHYAARSLGLDVRNILLIDDSDAGVTAAASAGMYVCAFGQQTETTPAQPQGGGARPRAHWIARDARELSALLGNLGLLTAQS
jgi:beta-phosphoglucomutase-like phosphatase (HAD superfamily)